MTMFRAGLAQIAPRLGDVKANLDKHLAYIEQARQQQVDLLVFPELSLTGYYVKDLVPTLAAHPVPGDPLLGPLLQASRDLDLVVGFVEQDARYRYYIAAAYLANGQALHVHRKVYLPTYRMFDDARYFAAGDRFRAFDTRWGRMGLTICEDAWHLSAAYLLWQDGADFIVDIAASPGYGLAADEPGTLASERTVNSFLHSYAELLTSYVLYTNRVGIEDGISFWGGSVVMAPDGRPLCTAPLLQEALVVAEIDVDALRRARLRLPTLRDERLDLVMRELDRIYLEDKE
ncbi:MAG: nitrilase-related carbon-nitrogen hydrolase [Anaerolineae bacterium]